MIGLGVLAGAFVIGLPVAVIYLLVGQSALRTQIAALERKLYQLTADTKQASQSQVAVSEPTVENGKPPKAAAKVKTSPAASAATVMASRQAEVKATVAGNPKEPVTPSCPNLFDRLVAWLSENWFYAVSAVSLALAGLFLVQYGMENCTLPPAARVASALAFGLGLIGVGEYIRRRFGEAEDSATAYLPSVFAGAGLVSLFGAVLSAQMLYGLIGGTTAMIGLIAVAGIAMFWDGSMGHCWLQSVSLARFVRQWFWVAVTLIRHRCLLISHLLPLLVWVWIPCAGGRGFPA